MTEPGALTALRFDRHFFHHSFPSEDTFSTENKTWLTAVPDCAQFISAQLGKDYTEIMFTNLSASCPRQHSPSLKSGVWTKAHISLQFAKNWNLIDPTVKTRKSRDTALLFKKVKNIFFYLRYYTAPQQILLFSILQVYVAFQWGWSLSILYMI